VAFRIIRRVSSRGELREKVLEVSGELLRIGRGALNELRLDDLAVSLTHAEVRRDEQGSYILRDVSQGQTLYLNRLPVKEAVLQQGDIVKIQNYGISVLQPDPSGSLVLSIEEEAATPVEPFPALMPRLQLSSGGWTKWRIAVALLMVLSVGSVLAGVWTQGAVFMPGDVSVKHSKFSSQCEVCHARVKPVWSFVDDTACQACHRPDILPPSHFKQEVALSTPPVCASCHLEHKGQNVLADVSDGKCVQCHADLQAKGETVPDIAAVHGFSTDHPEFAITRSGLGREGVVRVRLDDTERLKDEAQLKLNHALHLKLETDYLDNMGMTPLTCSNCHRMDDEGHNMEPISFQRDCVQCHSGDIELAPILPGRRVTHGRQLDELRRQLDEIFSGEYLQAHPEEAKQPEQLRWIPGRRLPGQPQTPQERYVVGGRTEGEKILLSSKVKKCLKCHVKEDGFQGGGVATGHASTASSSVEADIGVDSSRPAVDVTQGAPSSAGTEETAKPRIARVNVPVRWLPYSRFDHRAHAAIPELRSKGQGNWCVPCHENAVGSVTSDDVLLPSIALCRTCHVEPGGAQASCKSCHEFHVPKLNPSRTHPVTRVSAYSGRSWSSPGEEFAYV
jgi:hypothetical protein